MPGPALHLWPPPPPPRQQTKPTERWRCFSCLMMPRRRGDGIASRLSRAKIKCSICSSQFNTWDAQHRWALVLIVCLNRGRRFKACFVAPTGCPGIAVPPGSAHTCQWRVSIALHHHHAQNLLSTPQASKPAGSLAQDHTINFRSFCSLARPKSSSKLTAVSRTSAKSARHAKASSPIGVSKRDVEKEGKNKPQACH